MKRMKRLIILAMAFLLLIPNYLGDAYTKDLSVSGYYYGRYDFGVRFIARYYGDSQTGVLTDNNQYDCQPVENVKNLFDCNTSTGLILRDASGTWTGNISKGDYIGVEFEKPINLNGINFILNSTDTYRKAELQYQLNGSEEWVCIKEFNYGKINKASYSGLTISNVKAVRLQSTNENNESGVWIKMQEIEIDGTEYVEPSVVDKSDLISTVETMTKLYADQNAYTENSFRSFKLAYESAISIIENNSVTQAEVNNILQQLVMKRSLLVLNSRDLGVLINTETSTDVVVLNCDAEHEAATNTLDYNNNTKWHSPWGNNAVFPVSVTYDLGKAYDLTDLTFLPRQDGQRNGDIFQFELYVGETSDNLQLIGVFNMETTGTESGEQLTNRGQFKRATFNATGRYVKMKVTRAGSEAIGELNTYASMAEIRFYGTEKTEEDDGYISNIDKTMLGDLIDQADSLIGTDNSAGQYTASSFATYVNALNTAILVYDDDLAVETLVTEVYNLLKEAMDNLVDVEVLTMNLEIVKEELTFRTDESEAWKVGYQAMIDELEALLTKANVTQDEIDAAVERLDVIEPYASLYEAIEEAKAIDTSNKTEDSVNALNTAITEAEAILNNKASTYDELEMHSVNVVEKVEQLVERTLDKTDLLAALEAARDIYEANNANNTYTNISFKSLKEAYDVANAMKDKDSTEIKQSEVDAVTKALTEALSTLLVADQYLTSDEIKIKVIGNEENDNTQALSNIFDGNPNTVWHTKWGGSDRNLHYFTLQVPVNYYDQIELLPRPKTGDGYQNGVFTEVKVYAKLYAPKDNVEQGDRWIEVAHATGLNQDGWQVVEFNEPVKAEYIKVEVVNAMSANNKLFASLAEMKIHSSAAQLDNENWKVVAYFDNDKIAEFKDSAVPYEKAESGLDEKEGPAEYMFDGTTATHYHTDYKYKDEDFYRNPITIIVKTGVNQTFNYIDWLNRKDNTACRLSKFDVYTIDTNKEYTDEELKNSAPWVKKFAITAENQANNRFYPGEQTTKYIKIVATSSDSGYHLTCAELDFYQVDADESGEIRYSGMNATLDSNKWIKESAYNQNKEVKGYYGLVNENDTENSFSNNAANLVKYVTSSVLSVKAQSTITEDNKINVRFITSVASLNLEILRFKVEVIQPNGSSKANYLNVSKVYKTIFADDVEITNAANVFGNEISTHFAVCKLNGIPVSLASVQPQTKIKVTPYWAPMDVELDDYKNYVEGISREFTIQELYEHANRTETFSNR